MPRIRRLLICVIVFFLTDVTYPCSHTPLGHSQAGAHIVIHKCPVQRIWGINGLILFAKDSNQSSCRVDKRSVIHQKLVQDGGNFQATYTRSRASRNAFPSRSLGTRINRFSRSQAPAWECMPRSSASSFLPISALRH